MYLLKGQCRYQCCCVGQNYDFLYTLLRLVDVYKARKKKLMRLWIENRTKILIKQITLYRGNIYMSELAPCFCGRKILKCRIKSAFYDNSFPCFCFFCRLRTRKPRIPAWIFTADFSSMSVALPWLVLPDSVILPELLRRAERRRLEMSPGALI